MARRSQDRLTAREREVVQLLAEGHSVNEIAELLNRHPSTIYEHLYRVRERLNLKNDAQIGVYAVQTGLVMCAPRHP
ncbi:MAG TPA: helix-turn-helix transcriptional regulator [Thermomicrobiales bacterium]